MADTMTNREFYTAVIKANISEELNDFAKNAVEKLDAKNKAKIAKPSATQLENEKIKVAMLATFNEKSVKTANEVGVTMGISTSKASALLRQLVEVKKLKQAEIKVTGKGKCKVYALDTENETENETED